MYKKLFTVVIINTFIMWATTGCGQHSLTNVKSVITTDTNTQVNTALTKISNNALSVATKMNQDKNFDPAVYEDKDWNINNMGKFVRMKISGYYGNIIMTESEQGTMLTILYDMAHIPGIAGDISNIACGEQVELFMDPDKNLYLCNTLMDRQNPVRLCFDKHMLKTLSSELTQHFAIDNILGSDIIYQGYKKTVEEDGKVIDICEIALQNGNQTVLCDAYVDRKSGMLQQIVKQADSEDPYDYSMTLQSVQAETLQKPSWTEECKLATNEQLQDLSNILYGLNIIMSQQDLNNSVLFATLSDNIQYDNSEDDTVMLQKLHSAEYWENKLGSYNGYYCFDDGTEVTVFDKDDTEYLFVWNEDAQDYKEE